ncbi:MAG: DUF1232 domain-containing protein [Gammaproteobacteria bacterium]|nr:MAG: DUF1232 domain-containing protein [Gammaproteobacteria bacterium]
MRGRYGRSYSEPGFWRKLQRGARSAGRELLGIALELYYVLQSPGTPVWARTAILGALGYFISIFDAVPDFIPGAGYADDLSVLAAALAAVTRFVTPEVKARAREKLAEWFPDGD